MNTHYVSEFARFMDNYLHTHPEVVDDQLYGFDIYWKAQGDALPVPDNVAEAQRAESGPHASHLEQLLHAAKRSVA